MIFKILFPEMRAIFLSCGVACYLKQKQNNFEQTLINLLEVDREV